MPWPSNRYGTPQGAYVVGCATGVLASDDLPHDVPHGGLAGGVLVVDEGVPVRGGDLNAFKALLLVLHAADRFLHNPAQSRMADVDTGLFAEFLRADGQLKRHAH